MVNCFKSRTTDYRASKIENWILGLTCLENGRRSCICYTDDKHFKKLEITYIYSFWCDLFVHVQALWRTSYIILRPVSYKSFGEECKHLIRSTLQPIMLSLGSYPFDCKVLMPRIWVNNMYNNWNKYLHY